MRCPATAGLLDRQPLQTPGLVVAGVVVDHLGAVAVQPGHRRGVLADHQPADHLGRALDLRIALPVAELIAVDPALVAVAVCALAATGEHSARHPVAVEVVAHPLGGAQAAALVRGALPPAGDVGPVRAAIVALLDLAAERGVAVCAKAAGAAAGADLRPGGSRPDQIANRSDRERRPGDRYARQRPAA